jgi:hypothetical protein
MHDIHQRLGNLGIVVPEILLPKTKINLKKWSVIACDQFTQDREYWSNIEQFVGNAPSTLRLIFPEIYLNDPGKEDRIKRIHETMRNYLQNSTLMRPKWGMIYLERSTPYRQRRRGLLTIVDLEQYDWKKDAQTLIRATEETVEERLPPRMAVRRNAPLECPHVILLIDDEEDALLPGLADFVKDAPPEYQTPLTAGDVTGWLLREKKALLYLAERLETLSRKSADAYGGKPFLYAVGDGNHSLASAKAVWEEYKTLHPRDRWAMYHPCRYALVEIENIYDPGIVFEPIHRLMLGANQDEVKNLLKNLPEYACRRVETQEELTALVEASPGGFARLGLVTGTEYALAEFRADRLATDHLQPLLDEFLAGKGSGYGIDYVHGRSAVFARNYAGTGILLPPIGKAGLFQTVARRGPLPRKSFSMGEAEEKRFYLECRQLFAEQPAE